ncbi:four-carbon acid sugar kinase family protein [Paenibacillus oryzisoli]|uniref:Type III effector n=1 Tax=Paenibacillus oryzisoli TaxID=1850517 RepID=A0A198A9Y2_9BACL|nr:four-carbon acid sugar kinase family protein [Paenibacillus oryzisoli]OAS17972.1 type III effector [Paenibacillus oryzisoli]
MNTQGDDQGQDQVGRLLCYYGDDFTGSTDVLEALFAAGLSTVLFLEPPSPERLNTQFRDVACFGVAGVGRSLSPEEMERELRPIFATLQTAGAAVIHYKICSTFDSSPGIGSIGKAMEIGREVFGGRYIPLVVGVPYLRRYTVFGQHFAGTGVGTGAEIHRLDRHPTMARHPVTPMAEADLRKHLHEQTLLRSTSFDLLALEGAYEEVKGRLAHQIQAEQPDIVVFDVLDEQRLQTTGRLIWEEAESGEGLFVVGSSGIEYALTAAWRADELLASAFQGKAQEDVKAVDRLFVVSGSCSPITEKQIQRAIEAGFMGIRVPVDALLRPALAAEAYASLLVDVQAALESGRSVVVYSASGPQDGTIALIRETLAEQGLRAEDSGPLLGKVLGTLTRQIVADMGLSRILIAGGDTSGYITRELGIYALSCKAALEPGGPLCRAYSSDSQFDGLEVVLKGGQVGGEHFFERVKLADSCSERSSFRK